jgi:beta-lactamase class A
MTGNRPEDATPVAARDGLPEGGRAAACGRRLERARPLAMAGALAAAAVSPLPAQGLASARAAIEARIAASGAEAVGVYAQDLERADTLQIGAAIRFHAASMMKVPVMIQVFRDADAGRLRLGGRIPVTNVFRSLVDGSPYALSAGDDSDSSLYNRVGRSATLRELVELMITASSNLATNIVIDRVQAARAQATAVALGADSIQVRRGVEDSKAFRAGLNNTTTARDLGVLFAALAQGRAASGASCRTMLDVLGRQRFNEGIPAGLPAGTRVAHKTGWITGTHHDGGVVTAADGRRYVLVVLTRGIQDEAASARLIADVAGLVHGALSPR